MNKTLIMSAALVALFSASAQAQTARQTRQARPYQQQQEEPVRSDKEAKNIEVTPYFGIRGIASFQKGTANVEDLGIKVDETFYNGGFETAVGTKITDNFRVEFAYAWRSGKSEKTQGLKLKPTVQAYMINGYVDLPTAAKVRPYLGVGVGMGRAKYGSTYSGVKENLSKTKFTYGLSAGLTYEATEALSWDFGYRYADFGKFDGIKTKANEILVGARFAFR